MKRERTEERRQRIGTDQEAMSWEERQSGSAKLTRVERDFESEISTAQTPLCNDSQKEERMNEREKNRDSFKLV